jgi:stage II sporulation protein D
MKLLIVFAALIVFMAHSAQAMPAPEYIRVGLTRSHGNQAAITVANTALVVGYDSGTGFVPLREISGGPFTIRAAGTGWSVSAGGNVLHTFAAGSGGRLAPVAGAHLRLGAYYYRGMLDMHVTGSNVTAVNVVLLEEYLYGVVPVEMSPSWHIEALKAQAVTARTFAVYNSLGASHTGFDVCDTTCCQDYRGTSREHENTTRAVRETSGIMVRLNGNPVPTHYSASSGGMTANSEDTWWAALPHLRAVAELGENVPDVWQRTFTWAQLTQIAQANNAGIGNVTGFSVSETAPGGRALEITFHGTGGNWSTRRGDNIRRVFSAHGGWLRSNNFYVEGARGTSPAVSVIGRTAAPVNTLYMTSARGGVTRVQAAYIYDGTATRRVETTPQISSGGTGITLHGRGHGHGVGMSQQGAHYMARAGFSFWEILAHYYTGVDIW